VNSSRINTSWQWLLSPVDLQEKSLGSSWICMNGVW